MRESWSGHDLLCGRLGHGLTRAEAAALFGVTVEAWRQWEREGPPPDVDGLADWIREGLV